MDHPNIAKILDAGVTGEAEPRNADFPVCGQSAGSLWRFRRKGRRLENRRYRSRQ